MGFFIPARGIVRSILFIVGTKRKKTFCELWCCTSKVGERTLPSKQVGRGVEHNLIGRTDGLMPSGIPRGPSATLPEERAFID